ncbi:MAG: hypothetical protein PHY80_00140 [Rickettsiales bacterium]|nr:hypothetical protein [Rickettsiales bacterium]
MEELIEKVKKLDRNKILQEKLDENQSINLKMFKVKKEIVMYFVANKLKSNDDIIRLREITDYMIKTCRIKYNKKVKLKRLNLITEKLNKLFITFLEEVSMD